MGNLGLHLRPLCAGLSGAMALDTSVGSAVASDISTSALSLVAARASIGSAKHVLASVVTSCDDGPFSSGLTLREAIADAGFFETIDMSELICPSSTITLNAGAIYVPNKSMHLLGPADGSLTIDANGTDRVFFSYSPLLQIEYLTINGGLGTTYDGKGGCIHADGDVTLKNSIVSGGQAVTGGGCIFASGDVTLQHSTVTNCNATNDAYYHSDTAYSGEPTLGGGILASSVTLSDASRIGDSAAVGPKSCREPVPFNLYCHWIGRGGGVFATTVTCTDSTIRGNVAWWTTNRVLIHLGGAGIDGSLVSLTRCTIDHNDGNPGIFIDDGQATIVNSTISGNTFGIVATGGNAAVTLTSSTVAMNGVGVYLYYHVNLTAQSSILAGNNIVDLSMSYSAPTGADNLIVSTNATPGPGVITVTADPQLLPLDDNGGPTHTHALEATSPAINKGNNAAVLATDQRGDGFVRAFGRPDIGAYELQVTGDEIFYGGFD